MSGFWCDPFDQYADAAHMLQGPWAEVGSFVPSTAKPRTGTKSLFSAGGGSTFTSARRIFGAPVTEAGVAYGLWIDSLPRVENNEFNGGVSQHLFIFTDAAADCQVVITLGTDGAVVPYRGFNWKELGGDFGGFQQAFGRSLPCIVAGSWNHIEAKVVIDPTNGAIEVRVNGATVFNVSGVNTQGTSNTETSQVVVTASASFVTLTTETYIDDMHAWHTDGTSPSDFVGNAAVVYRPPVNDTADAGWSAFGGGPPVYPLLSDNNDATGIEAATANLTSGFLCANLSSDITGVVYQMASWRGLKSDAGNCTVTPGFKSSGVTVTGAGQPLLTGETWFDAIFPLDPNGNIPWTPAAASASEITITRSE